MNNKANHSIAVEVDEIQKKSEPATEHNKPAPETLNIARKTGAVDYWDHPAVIAPNNFQHKSLSNWSLNFAMGCNHGCRFCYVPSVSANKQGPKLAEYGIDNPDEEWGDYVLLRKWNEKDFLKSLLAAERTLLSELKPDGNRAIIVCSTTDAYQTLYHADSEVRAKMNAHLEFMVRRSLELIRDKSTLHVRILTRSPLARRDFDLFKSFGPRLMFGMSLPTLRNDLAAVYEPKAPAPTQRLATLQAVKEAGLHVFVAMAPTYPESDEADLRRTMEAIAALKPYTVFHEPINIRAENVRRIKSHAETLGVTLRSEVFDTPQSWRRYAVDALATVEYLAVQVGLHHQIHLWPDGSLGTKTAIAESRKPDKFYRWIQKYWNKISAWPPEAFDAPFYKEKRKKIDDWMMSRLRMSPAELMKMPYEPPPEF